MKEYIKNIFKHILAGLAVIILIMSVYVYSYYTGGDLTTVHTCSGSYLKGDMTIQGVNKSCPNMSKQSLVESVNKYFKNHLLSVDGRTETEILIDIENNFK